MKRILALALATTLGLTACSTSNTQGQNTAAGAVGGAVVGGGIAAVTGGAGGAIAAGAIVGALVGGYIGHSMDSTDNTRTYTVIDGGKTNMTVKWYNPRTRTMYTMTPTSDFFSVAGNPRCRNYHFTAKKHGHKMRSYNGTACHKTDGTWYTVR